MIDCCKDFEENALIIRNAMLFCHTQAGSGIKGGLKKSFIFCPYCGVKFKEEEK